MGTRAAFWLGNPVDLDNREWLGCVAWDGDADNFASLRDIATVKAFRATVAHILAERDDAALPNDGWPFPWCDDIFLTDCTYAFFDEQTHYACYHKTFVPLNDYLSFSDEQTESYHEQGNYEPHMNVSSGRDYDRTQPDSIIIISAKTNA